MAKDDDDYDAELERLQLGAGALPAARDRSPARRRWSSSRAATPPARTARSSAITEHLSVRNTRVVALPKPTDRERSQWYFQRYVRHLPAAGEIVIFNRSWYNRAGVEPVMGFCTADEHETFLRDVPAFEAMLIESGCSIVKLWLDISKRGAGQAPEGAPTDPLKALKVSAAGRRRPGEVGRLHRGARRDAEAHPHRRRALDHRPHRPQEGGPPGHHAPPAARRWRPRTSPRP